MGVWSYGPVWTGPYLSQGLLMHDVSIVVHSTDLATGSVGNIRTSYCIYIILIVDNKHAITVPLQKQF